MSTIFVQGSYVRFLLKLYQKKIEKTVAYCWGYCYICRPHSVFSLCPVFLSSPYEEISFISRSLLFPRRWVLDFQE